MDQSKNEKMHIDLKKNKLDYIRLEDSVKRLNNKVNNLSDNIRKLTEKNSELQYTIEQLSDVIDDYQEKITMMEELVKEKDTKISSLEHDVVMAEMNGYDNGYNDGSR